jgi:hypothetical protein
LKTWTPEAAARYELKKRSAQVSASPEDMAAYQNFAQDITLTTR